MTLEELEISQVLALVEQGVVDPCVWCGRSTAFGSGLFVNRISADREEYYEGTYVDGYACAECAGFDCDECGQFIYLDTEVRTEPYGNYHEHCYNKAKHGEKEKY